MKKIINRYLPTPNTITEQTSLRYFAPIFKNGAIWHLNRRSIASAFFIGALISLIPIPIQTIMVVLLCAPFRANLPLAFLLTLVSNPLTFAPIAYMDFTVGRWFLSAPEVELTRLLNDLGVVTDQLTHSSRQFAFGETALSDVTQQINQIWQLFWQPILKPFVLGALSCGLVIGAIGYFAVHLIWRWNVSRAWKARSKRRQSTAKD